MKRKSFLTRITRALLLGALLPILTIGLGALWWAERVSIDRTLFHLQSVAELQQARIQNLVEQNLDRYSLLASRTQLRLSLDRYQSARGSEADRVKLQRIINDALEALPAFSQITVLGLDGTVVASTESARIGTPLARRSANAPRKPDGAPSFALHRSDDGTMHARIRGPLSLDGQLIGELVAGMGSADLSRIVHNFTGLGATGETILARREPNGDALFLTATRLDPAAALRRRVDGTDRDLPINHALEGARRTFDDILDYRGQRVLAATSFIPALQWGVVAKMDRSEILSTIDDARVIAVAIVLATCAIVLVVAASLARSFRVPMQALLDASARFGRGELTSRITPQGTAEFIELADAFNTMASNLDESGQRIAREVERHGRLEERFRQIIESAPTAMILCNAKGRIELVNIAAERLFDYARDELIGQPIERLLPERYAAAHPAHREAYGRTPATRAMGAGRDLTGRRKDGTEVPIEIGLNPIRTDEGAMVLSAIIDLTERRSFESDLLEQNERLEKEDWLKTGQTELARRMRSANCIEELAERVLTFFCETFSATAGAFYVSDQAGSLVLRAGHALPSRGLQRTVALGRGLLGQAVKDSQIRFLDEAPPGHFDQESGLGASVPTSLAIVPLESSERTLGALELASFGGFDERHRELLTLTSESIAISVDILLSAERLRELLEESQRKSRELERASSYKSAFLANMSHELRTPLNSVLLLAKSLAANEGDRLSAEEQKSAAIIERSGLNLLALINDILDMSKIEAGKLDVASEAVDPRALIQEIAEQYSPLAESNGLRLDTVVHDDVPVSLQSDSRRLRQIVVNLVNNAMKFTREGSVMVDVSASVSSHGRSHIQIAVSDTGVGIEPDRQGEIFDAFHQVDASRTREQSGTGLGLSISRQLAGLLGGTITVRSTPGQGSTFTLTLPTRSTPAKPEPDSKVEHDPLDAAPSTIGRPLSAPARERVLVLDSDMRRAYSISGQLAANQIRGDIAPSIERAVQLLESELTFDAILIGDPGGHNAKESMNRELEKRLGYPIETPMLTISEDEFDELSGSFTTEQLLAAFDESRQAGASAA